MKPGKQRTVASTQNCLKNTKILDFSLAVVLPSQECLLVLKYIFVLFQVLVQMFYML